jgi:hypothetical protein
MIIWKGYGKKQLWPNWVTILAFALRDWGNPRRTSVWMDDVPAEIWTNRLLNTSRALPQCQAVQFFRINREMVKIIIFCISVILETQNEAEWNIAVSMMKYTLHHTFMDLSAVLWKLKTYSTKFFLKWQLHRRTVGHLITSQHIAASKLVCVCVCLCYSIPGGRRSVEF